MKKMKRFLSVLLCTFMLVGLLPVGVSAGPGDPPHEHPLVKTEKNEPASCSETGNKEYWTCETCGKYFGDKDGKKEIEEGSWIITGKHDLKKTDEVRVDACTKTGNTAYWTCDTCSKFFKDKDGKNEIEDGSWITTGPHKAKKEHAAKAATCTESGNIKYWSCDDCGKYFSDKECKNEISKADVVLPAQHTLTEHAAEASTCTEAGNTAYWSCGGCGKYFSDEGITEIEEDEWVLPAQHTLTEHAAEDPTCAADGNHAYWTCSGGCGKYFSNAEATAEYQLNQWVIPAVDHDYGNWITSSEQHWKECSFGHESEKTSHIYDNDADAFCNDCNYEREIEEEPEEELEINVSVDCPEIGDGLDALNVTVTNAGIDKKIEFEPKEKNTFAEGENKVKIILIPAEGETFDADIADKVTVDCEDGVTVRTNRDGKPEIKLERDGKLTIKLQVVLEAAEDPNDPPADPNPNPEPTEFEVTFDSKGGTAVAKQTVAKDGTATKPADPTKTEGDHNLRFLGWYEKDSTTSYDFDTPVTSKVELEAKWIKVHELALYASDGTYMTTLIVDEGDTVDPENIQVDNYSGGKVWYKMNKKGEATAEQYDFTKPVKGCADLIGDWTLIEYTITYNLDGGTVATANPATYNINSGAITLNNPTRDGYIFDGWTGSNGTTPEKAVTIAAGSTGNKTYTANWTRVIVYYTVSYDANGGTGSMTSVDVQANTAYELAANGFTAPSGKVFKCWKIGDTEYKAGEDIIVTSDVTVKAVWKRKATGLDYVPASGDNFPIFLWVGLLLFSAVALTEVVLLHRKRR